jgi:hypothetical protein
LALRLDENSESITADKCLGIAERFTELEDRFSTDEDFPRIRVRNLLVGVITRLVFSSGFVLDS